MIRFARALPIGAPMRLALWIAVCATTGALLSAAIYWTMFDPGWVTFLGGVLFAAVVSIASDASRARWALARRSAQLRRARTLVEEANARSQSATRAFQAAELRLRGLGDVLRSAVLFVDDAQSCRFHNRPAADKLGEPAARINGRPLRELLGEPVYAAVRPHLEQSLRGESAACDLVWRTDPAQPAHYAVRQLPLAGEGGAREVCLLVTPVQAPANTGAALRVAGDGGEALYLHAIARELTGWDDPKGKLKAALAQDRFLLVEQRIMPLAPGRPDPDCVEVLLRLQEEEDHLLPPGGFLPEAERLGMMEELDRWVVRRLITQRLEQRGAGADAPAALSCVNLSAAAVRSAGFARFVQAQLEQRRFDGRALCFEIAEHDVITLREELRRLIAMLKPFGCRFSVDGFGSAKGSFAALAGLAFDFLKVDGVIVQNMLRDPAARARAAAINVACHRIGVRTIAEFVESDATLAELRRIGVDYAQGFGIGRPAPLAAPRARQAA